MTDTTPTPIAITTKLISAGVSEGVLLGAMAHLFPDMSRSELWEVIQIAQAAAERRALRSH